MSKSVAVLGANGQVGSEIRALAKVYENYLFTFVDRSVLDISNSDETVDYFCKNDFDYIINCAAYTAVDKAETDTTMAELINVKAVESLAVIAKEKNISLVHLSTDYVFDGQNFKPYLEDDKVSPQSVYGDTKLRGEEALIKINPSRSIIIRTSWVYSSFGANFVKTMLRLGKEKDELGVIFDQVGTPTYARDLAKTILDILEKIKNSNVEVFHYSNEGTCSWYDFAKAIFEFSGVDCKVNAIETKDYPTPATRPHYSLLNKSKIKNYFSISIPYWRDSLKEALTKIGNN